MADERKTRYRDISDGLLRQRRNLLFISLLMPLFFLSGAKIEQINILGTTISITNPSIVKYSLIVLFGYFFLRYWQYYREENYVSDMHREMTRHIYHLESSYLNRRVRAKADFLAPNTFGICYADPRYSWGGRFVAIPENKDRVVFPFMRECEFYIYLNDRGYGNEPDGKAEFHTALARESTHWKPLTTSDKEVPLPSLPHFYGGHLRYSIFHFNLMRLIGACRYMLSESYFTDYQLPFIVAALSVGATVYAIFI